MPAPCLPLYTPTASTRITKINPNSLASHGKCKTNRLGKSFPCRARASSSSSVTDFDLYDLLGIHSTSDQSQIKTAYRSLQKRCHPDIAGPAGHDMAIILNEAYAVLSDPSNRLAYDKIMVKEQAKTAELRGYTGKPIYSVWFGSESEERAVFVDEVKCVGCLKCALSAEKTFAIESAYGRARVVAQWADPEHKIQEAIGACPVDCISNTDVGQCPYWYIEAIHASSESDKRSERGIWRTLVHWTGNNFDKNQSIIRTCCGSGTSALEFLMSKQPRGNVRVGMGNAAGARVSNIFTDVKKFHIRYQEAREKASSRYSKETDLQRTARMSAIQAIRSISNWLYWQTPSSGGATVTSNHYLIKTAHKSSEPDLGKLRDAAAARKKLGRQTPSKNYLYHEDYWIPLAHALPAPSSQNNLYSRTISKDSPAKESRQNNDKDQTVPENDESNPIRVVIPLGIAMIAASIVRFHGEGAVGKLDEHIGGSFALQIVNSSWLPVILTGIMWYAIGILAAEFVAAVRRN